MSWSKTLKHANKRWTIPAFGEQNVIHASPASLEETRPRREISMKRSFNAFHNFEVGQQGKKTDPGSVWTWSLSMSSLLLLTDAGSRRHFPAHVGRDTEARTIVKGHRGEFNFTTISNAWLFASKPTSMAKRERLMTERRVMKACAAIKAAKLIC